MTRQTLQAARDKADHALELFENGIRPVDIAERLGTSRSHISGMLQRARQRREKKNEVTE
jgi:DNA-binding transcriptional regulator LsrR (DeoR family)